MTDPTATNRNRDKPSRDRKGAICLPLELLILARLHGIPLRYTVQSKESDSECRSSFARA